MSDPTRPKHVLVVDDDEASRRLVEIALRRLDVEVVATGDPHQVIGLVRDLHPAVIVLDVMMPGLDGPMIAEQIRELAPEDARRAKILLWSALDAGELSARAERCGADAVVLKVAGPAVLVQEVGGLLDLWQS
ncbi:MAG: response regulator [Myxococcales bacterium]|nr:response regulator [Myxococcales bacterium]